MFKLESNAQPGRAVVLGSRGFVGAAVYQKLKQGGVSVLGVSSSDLDLTATDAASRLETLLQPGDAVVFISALTPDKGRDLQTLQRNLSMASAVGHSLASGRISHLTYVSSDAVYADADTLICEDSPAAPSSYHGQMHLVRETTLRLAAAGKTPLCILRPCSIYGAGDTHNSYGPNRFARDAVAKGVISLFGGGEEKRDHVFIDDVAEVVARSVRGRAQGVLNVASGRAVSFADVAAAVASASGKVVDVKTSPRANAITHKHFDITNLFRAFPTMQLTHLETGVRSLLK